MALCEGNATDLRGLVPDLDLGSGGWLQLSWGQLLWNSCPGAPQSHCQALWATLPRAALGHTQPGEDPLLAEWTAPRQKFGLFQFTDTCPVLQQWTAWGWCPNCNQWDESHPPELAFQNQGWRTSPLIPTRDTAVQPRNRDGNCCVLLGTPKPGDINVKEFCSPQTKCHIFTMAAIGSARGAAWLQHILVESGRRQKGSCQDAFCFIYIAFKSRLLNTSMRMLYRYMGSYIRSSGIYRSLKWTTWTLQRSSCSRSCFCQGRFWEKQCKVTTLLLLTTA